MPSPREPVLVALLAVGAAAAPRPAAAGDAPIEADDAVEQDLDAPPDGKGAGQRPLLSGVWGEFGLGTYGRVSADWDLRGGQGEPANVVAHGGRLEQAPYAELEAFFTRSAAPDGRDPGAPRFRVVFTLGFDEDLFHYQGDWQSGIALRNLYGEVDGLVGGRLRLWAGSRMYRGDDVYLLDFWPLDELNTLGGGAGLRLGAFDTAVHVGTNRIGDLYQYQEIQVVDPAGIGTETVVTLDRQRTIGSLSLGWQRPPPGGRGLGFKVKGWAEVHGIPAGEVVDVTDQSTEALPADSGFAVGGQIGIWGFSRAGFANLFFKYSRGLAAYGELSVPYGLDTDETAARAVEALGALSANYEIGPFGLMAGAYVRYFKDADPNVYDLDDRFEWTAALRPHLFVGRSYRQVFELSLQQLIEHGLDPETDLQEPAMVGKLSVIPAVALDRGTYTRPELRLVYTASFLDEGARLQYPAEDPRRDQAVQHYVGIGVEWWLNSSFR